MQVLEKLAAMSGGALKTLTSVGKLDITPNRRSALASRFCVVKVVLKSPAFSVVLPARKRPAERTQFVALDGVIRYKAMRNILRSLEPSATLRKVL